MLILCPNSKVCSRNCAFCLNMLRLLHKFFFDQSLYKFTHRLRLFWSKSEPMAVFFIFGTMRHFVMVETKLNWIKLKLKNFVVVNHINYLVKNYFNRNSRLVTSNPQSYPSFSEKTKNSTFQVVHTFAQYVQTKTCECWNYSIMTPSKPWKN